MTPERYDAVVIGAGQAGQPLAIEFARAGLHTALIEANEPGGACLNSGCAPSKTLMASASVARLARRAPDFGVATGVVAVDFGKVQQRKQTVVRNLRSRAIQALSDTPGLKLLTGEARFTGVDSLMLCNGADGAHELQADRIFINTGSLPALPDIAGLSRVPFLDSTGAMELDELPDHLLVVGGSYLAVELAQMFSRFGSRVSVVERESQLLPREDRDIAAHVAEILREDGVEVFVETEAVGVAPGVRDGVLLTVRTAAGEHVLSGSHLLVMSGRAPNTESLDLASAGVRVDSRGYIGVNERLETSVRGVYALGDVNGGPAFAHVAYDDFRIVRANVLENAKATTAGRMCPYTVFTDPQLGRIGLTEWEARGQGRNIRVAKLPMNRVPRAVELNETRGLIKVMVDTGDDRIAGAAVLGVDGGEIMAMLQIAMMANMPYTLLRDGIFAHPTLAESLNELFTTLDA
jgi:pyruvate/2-oxoglutarate dehydrogenase complex dihydrolipoamide dehydrogenase (E3) component